MDGALLLLRNLQGSFVYFLQVAAGEEFGGTILPKDTAVDADYRKDTALLVADGVIQAHTFAVQPAGGVSDPT